MTHRTIRTVQIRTRTVGQHFGTVGQLTTRRGRVVAESGTVRPYGFVASAVRDAELLAARLGLTVE